MSRRYADRIRVTAAVEPAGGSEPSDRVPQSFRWRRERYQVVAVLARWVEANAWWRTAVPGGRRTTPVLGGSFERVVWRVEARTRTGAGGVYDLGHDLPLAPDSQPPDDQPPDRWFLVRALD